MQNYRKTSHSIYDLKVHLVWITKYRKPVLFGDVAVRLRDLIREVCKSMEVEIIKGHVSKDHVHLFVSVPPQWSVSKVMGRIKGKTARCLLANHRLSRKFWGRHLRARGYFAASTGNAADEVIMQSIEEQDLVERARGVTTSRYLPKPHSQAAVGYKQPPSRRLLIDLKGTKRTV